MPQRMSRNAAERSSDSQVGKWDADLYVDKHSFVWKFGASIVEDVLDPQPGERILDVGCGSGELTKAIADRGAEAIGIDADARMIEAARARYGDVDFCLADARELPEVQPVDAVFSNAALHWIPDAERAVRSMSGVLKPGGRFVAEFGGRGNIASIVNSALRIKAEAGIESNLENPWYFPSIGEYVSLLELHGIEVTSAALFDRPTPLEDGEAGLTNWLRMFGDALLGDIDDDELKDQIIARINEELRPHLWDGEKWTADYRRIRIVGKKVA